ncbi:hypothetical protein L226DRAFT_539336 [Lentinus tigrinus ALCF2SS1-7]|uniref:uncharacterized protein n=1 Tax=Lentinus tigrinus ALCF2SS1-7 TaxID=1328758 RepID=UPI001165CC85|nr:hypothetical protein L226DRAFT_539336 [Lentinus tigrinus ALCF2SS1-7]
MSPQVPPPLPALDNTFGAVLLGTFFGIILYGMTLHQSYRYYRLYPKDKLWLKGVVSLTILMETIHTFLACHVCYYYLVSNYFKPTALLFGSWSIKLLLICSGGVIIVAQSFFAWRVFLVGPQYRLLVFAAMSLLVGELAFFLAATIETFMIPTFSGFEHLTWLISTGSAMAITADLLLTTVLIVTLHRSRTGIKRTDSIIDVLILYALSTGLLTSIFNILSFLFTVLYIDNLIYVAFALVVTKLYANTLLVALNTRSTLTGNGGIIEASDVGVYGMSVVFGEPTTQRVTLPRAPSPSRGPESSVLELKVTTSSFVVDDSGQRLA